MSRVIILHLAPDQVSAVVAHVNGGELQVQAVEIVPIVSSDIAPAAKQLVAALEPHHPSKAKVLLAVPSSSIKWHYLTLPPSPPEDLPALVRLQLDLDSSREDEAIGYDFLPLAGSEDRPQRVLAMVLKVADLARAHSLGRVSGLRIDGIVPLAFGWLGFSLTPSEQTTEAEVFVATQDKEATIWARWAGEMALLRQVQLPEEPASETAVAVLASQLRRTLLSLAQEGISTDSASISIVGEPLADISPLAESLGNKLGRVVQTLTPEVSNLSAMPQAELNNYLPLLGLALHAARGESPIMDFLHPRKPPAPKSNNRTLVLAGIAASLLTAIVGWQGYTTLNEPVWRADQLDDEVRAINLDLESLEVEERDAARIGEWLDASPNLLAELANLSTEWRPQPPDSPVFEMANDGVLKRIDLTRRTLVLEGNVASSAAVQPLENRLRDSGHRV